MKVKFQTDLFEEKTKIIEIIIDFEGLNEYTDTAPQKRARKTAGYCSHPIQE